jgi:hypothetical protein
MMVKAAFGAEYSYDSNNSASWQEQVVAFAASKGVVSSFSDYNTAATRGFVFEAGNNSIIAADETANSCDEVSALLGLCGGDSEDTTEEDTTDEDTTEAPVNGSNVLTAELSADTPTGGDIAEDATGVSVLTFDITAGSEDVSVSAVEVERVGFGEGAVNKVIAFADGSRISKDKAFTNDVANMTFSPNLVVKAGETTTVTVKGNMLADTNGEFALSVKNITATSTVESSTIVSNYFESKDVRAVDATFTYKTVSDVKVGEEQVEIAKFTLKNNGQSSSANISTDTDVVVSSVTLKETNDVDQETSLENLTLTHDGNVISTVASINGKYVTFNFDDLVIEDGKTETFYVKSDIM